MKRIVVKSSMMRSIGYQPETQTLEIEFSSGAVYRYPGFPPEEWDMFRLERKSLGAHFSARIRDKYRGVKVETKQTETGIRQETATETDASGK